MGLALMAALVSLGCRAADMGARDPLPSSARPLAAPSKAADHAPESRNGVPLELGLFWPSFPEGFAPRDREVVLGRELFSERALSADRSLSCETCHDPGHGFADPRPQSIGVHGQPGTRNSPTLLNAAYFDTLGWSGEHPSIEAQSLAAITNPLEMGVEQSEIAARLEPLYGDRLRELYGDVSPESAGRALAAFQRTLVAGDSPFDRYIYANDSNAVSEMAKRGFEVFIGEARCIQCHFMRSEASHPFGGSTGTFTDNRFHNIGVGFDEHGNTSDEGRREVSKEELERGAFKTPTLRNVALTAPYMHDGSLATLLDVVQHYDKGGVPNSNLDPDVKPLRLTDVQKAELVAFLESLTSVKLANAASGASPPKLVLGGMH